MKQKLKAVYQLLILIGLMALAGGCSVMETYQPAGKIDLTTGQEAELGAAVEKRLIQILGGSYHDKELDKIMGRFADPVQLRVVIAERSAIAMYPLPGRRVIVTRGLLAELEHLEQLEEILGRAGNLSRTAYHDQSSSRVVRATAEFFAGGISIYDPHAPDIILAETFADTPCADRCLNDILTSTSGNGKALPEPVENLKTALAGYELLGHAKKLEKAGAQNQAIATYLEAATVTPDNARILSELGMAYLRAGDMQSARLHLQKAESLGDNYYKTRMGLGYVFLHTGRIRQANTFLAESVQLLPVTENLFLLAEAREKSGDTSGASELYRVVADNDPYSKLGRAAAKRLKQQKADQ